MIVAQIERGTLVEQIVAARASLLAAKNGSNPFLGGLKL